MVNLRHQEWRVRLSHLPYFDDEWEVVPYLATQKGVVIAVPNNEGWELRTFEQGEPIPNDLPTLKVNGQWIRALRDEIDKHFLPTDAQLVQKELKATQYHLEDLRKLLKLKRKK